jgi:hypothetical protein
MFLKNASIFGRSLPPAIITRSASVQRTARCTFQSTAIPSSQKQEKQKPPSTASLSPRWLSDVKQRVGHCLMWGLQPAQIDEAGQILHEIAQDWRELVAGSEGFLTDRTRRGLFRQEVVWGEMDSMVSVIAASSVLCTPGCVTARDLG